LGSSNVQIQSSQGATVGNGDININDIVTWSAHTLTLTAARNVNVNAVMTATGSASLDLKPATATGRTARSPAVRSTWAWTASATSPGG
jgi:hypothetical protein